MGLSETTQNNNLSPAHETIVQSLKNRFKDVIIMYEEEPLYHVLNIIIKKEYNVDVINYLYSETDLQFNFLTSMFGVHYPDKKDNEIGIVYLLKNLQKNLMIRIKTFLPISNPQISTITSVFSAANWMERETYDFYGVIFKGHPNLKRILNVEDIDFFPMRKSYPLEDQRRQDKDNSMFGR